MSNELHTTLRTVSQIFVSSDFYTIPIYQRNYSWRAEQIEQLISDVRDALEDQDDGYFLGNLIVTERRTSSGGGKEGVDFEVIDGQQRLTTLFLLCRILQLEFNTGPSMAVRYESRPRSAAALSLVAAESSPRDTSILDATCGEDAGILEGYNVIRQFLDQHLPDGEERKKFADYLWQKVTVVRASLPAQTDLNRYFEIMNTRGQQLQQVDIVKARLMSRLRDETEQACFAWIWDVCADMDSYVQMSLTPGDTKLRSEIFGDDWSWVRGRGEAAPGKSGFSWLLAIWQGQDGEQSQGDDSSAGTSVTTLTLDEALEKYARAGESMTAEDEANERFRSTIEFPAFLLHVLEVASATRTGSPGHERDDESYRASDQREARLDDKRLIKRFDEAIRDAGASGSNNAEEWVRDFAFRLLRLRTLFDSFVIKRQFTAASSEVGDWSLQRLVRREATRGGPRTSYVNTFSESRDGVEEDGGADPTTRQVLLIESMLRITYTSPRTMTWVTDLLRFLDDRDPTTVRSSEIVGLLQEYARGKVREAFFGSGEPTGFEINRIVFTYLDYLLLTTQHADADLLSSRTVSEYRFAFRNSIEHFYPQHPAADQDGTRVTSDRLDRLGNLALVSVGANSKFSNSLPRAKAENFGPTILDQSPKLELMAEITRREGWGDPQVLAHHYAMVRLLEDDLQRSSREQRAGAGPHALESRRGLSGRVR